MTREKFSRCVKPGACRTLALCLLSFGMTVLVMAFLFRKNGYVPFGVNSLACMDANIQYLDLFSYLKDVFSGTNSLSYTFGKTLGGSGIAVFSYYLSSPFSLLAAFFKKENLVLFFNIAAVLKIATAALSEAYFLRKRFSAALHGCFVVLLSMSYGLMQYNIAQSSNIMWLDGVFMLPLMSLGVYKIVRGERPYLLIFSTGVSILFNWYTGGINCLFTALWLLLELLLAPQQEVLSARLASAVKVGCKYVVSMLCGVFLSSVLFLPTLCSLLDGGRGKMDWKLFFTHDFNGNFLNFVQNFILGSTSSKSSVSLFCGSLALFGCVGFFVSKQISASMKKRAAAVVFAAILCVYWQPLYTAFSLFQAVGSYWCRYSYTVLFLLVFIAAAYYSGNREGCLTPGEAAKVSVMCSLIPLTLDIVKPGAPFKLIFNSCLFFTGIAVLSSALQKALRADTGKKLRIVIASVLFLAVGTELAYNAHLLLKRYHAANGDAFREYSLSQQEQVRRVKEFDPENFRISQTATYNQNSHNRRGVTANYNEALAYNYWSISGYTSDPDGRQSSLLERLGYRINGQTMCMCIVNTSVLPADSLLGVKYVLSKGPLEGLEKLPQLGNGNGKDVYYNPYALPLAFVCAGDFIHHVGEGGASNPFVFLNETYKALAPESPPIFIPLKFSAKRSRRSVTYTMPSTLGNYGYYGNIPWRKYMDNAEILINGKLLTVYARWLSPGVFPIQVPEDSAEVSVTLRASSDLSIKEEQFYAVDLGALRSAAERIRERSADNIRIENGHVSITACAHEGETLFTSIPYAPGWTVTRNGEEVSPALFEKCLMLIPLVDGENVVTMNFEMPGLAIGGAVSAVTLFLVMAAFFYAGAFKRPVLNRLVQRRKEKGFSV